jgi:uncharacterized protein YaiI (UPF0178 family)
MLLKPAILAVLAAVSVVSAHPGETHDKRQMRREANIRHAIADINMRALEKCGDDAYVKERRERAMQRRLETFQRLRAERGLSHG